MYSLSSVINKSTIKNYYFHILFNLKNEFDNKGTFKTLLPLETLCYLYTMFVVKLRFINELFLL